MRLEVYQHEFEFPQPLPPEWHTRVERWYQLDAAAHGLIEVYWQNRSALESRGPKWMVLASPGASNETDAQFCAAPSPAKFVHTLPNIRSAPLLQVMTCSAPVICIQNDPATLIDGLSEAAGLAAREEGAVWVLTVRRSGKRRLAEIYVVNSESGRYEIRRDAGPEMANSPTRDTDLLAWFEKSGTRAFHGGDLWIE